MEKYLCECCQSGPVFFDFSTDVAMATNFGQNWRNDLHSTLWHFKTDWNIAVWMDKQLYSDNHPSTLCTNMVNFGPAIYTFETIRQKSAYLTKYLNNYRTDLYQRFSFGRGMYADYKIDIGFTVVQWTLL